MEGAIAYSGLSERQLRRLVNERRIPFVKELKLLYFKPADLDAWIDAHYHAPILDAPPTPPRKRGRPRKQLSGEAQAQVAAGR
jgi:hypothetical protein